MVHRKEIEQRVATIAEMIVTGATRADVVVFCAKTWGVACRQADVYLARARTLISDVVGQDKEEAIAEHILIRRRLRKQAIDSGDVRLALVVLKEEAKLLGLYPHPHTEVTVHEGYVEVQAFDYENAIQSLKPHNDDGNE